MRMTTSLITLRFAAVAFFDSWKVDADGNLVKDANGNPIRVDDKNKEQSVAVDTISKLNGEAMGHRERAELAENKLKAFDGLDPAAARTAVDRVKKLGDKQLYESGDVEKLKEEITKGFTDQMAGLQTELSGAHTRIADMAITNAFNGSKFVQEKLIIPADIARQAFGRFFTVDPKSGAMTIKRDNGGEVFSNTRHGEKASVDEALEILVGEYANKDKILKGDGQGGSGNEGNGGNGGVKPGTMKRAEFDKLPPAERSKVAIEGKIKVVD